VGGCFGLRTCALARSRWTHKLRASWGFGVVGWQPSWLALVGGGSRWLLVAGMVFLPFWQLDVGFVAFALSGLV
jgi:hypothetical protein